MIVMEVGGRERAMGITDTFHFVQGANSKIVESDGVVLFISDFPPLSQ